MLLLGEQDCAPAFAARVGPHGTVESAATATDATGTFDLICAFSDPVFHGPDLTAPAAVLGSLRPAAQFWVFDDAAHTGELSMRISTVLAHAGFALVDLLERRSVMAMCAMAKG